MKETHFLRFLVGAMAALIGLFLYAALKFLEYAFQ